MMKTYVENYTFKTIQARDENSRRDTNHETFKQRATALEEENDYLRREIQRAEQQRMGKQV